MAESTPAKSAVKPGRKFGLTGSRQQWHQQAVSAQDGGWKTAGLSHPSAHCDAGEGLSLSEREMEDKYNTIRLSIRTDGMTLRQRLEHQRSERDLVEDNLNREVDILNSLLLVGHLLCSFQFLIRHCVHHCSKNVITAIRNHRHQTSLLSRLCFHQTDLLIITAY